MTAVVIPDWIIAAVATSRIRQLLDHRRLSGHCLAQQTYHRIFDVDFANAA